MAPVMIIGSVPLYNIMAVVVLSFFKPGQSKIDKEVLKKTLKGIITNPIIIGIVVGLLWLGMPSSIFRNPGEDGDKYWKHGNSDGTYGNGSDL